MLEKIQHQAIHNSYNIGTCDLPDMHAQSSSIRQITSAYVTTTVEPLLSGHLSYPNDKPDAKN